MKRKFFKLTGRAALLAAFLPGLFLPAGARAQDNGQAPVQAPKNERDHPVWLRIMAFTDAPVVGADVRVSVHGRLLVDAKAATNNQGVFPARIWRPWLLAEEAAADAPERERHRRRPLLRISISGGTMYGGPFLGHLSADFALTDPPHRILVVNPVTTLVSRVLDERPELSLHEAEALVRRFLKLPANYSLGLALRQSSHYVSPFFSAGAFMAEAGEAGGLEAFAHLLLQELASGSTHPFRPPQLLGSTGSNFLSVLKAGLYAGLLDVAGAEGVGSLAGWALSYTGLATPGGSDGDIAALQQSLQDLQSSIDNLSTQVAQLTQLVQATATQTQYITITTTAQTLAGQVNDEENRLMYLAQDCPPLPDGSIPPALDPTSFCATEPGHILSALSSQPIYSSYTNVEGYVQDNGTLGTAGMLHLYSLWLGQSKQFFRPADSTKMQNLYDYWDGVLTQAADLKVELLHQEKEQDTGGATLIAFMGNPDANPPTTGTFQANEAANLKLMFPAVPESTVIATQTHLMWATGYPMDLNQPPYLVGCPSQFNPPFNFPGYGWELGPSYGMNFAGLSSWTSPTLPVMQGLIKGWSGSSPMSWLIAQSNAVAPGDIPTSAGFYNVTACPGGGNVWTTTQTGSPNSGTFNAVSMHNGGVNVVRTYPNGGLNWQMITRPLAQSEQYYWYP